MLGESFFEAGHELVKASSYGQVSDLLFGRIRKLIGAAEVVLFDFATDLSVVRVVGEGPVAETLRQDLEGVRGWISEHDRRFPDDSSVLCTALTGGELREAPDVAEWLKQIGCSDIIGARLIRGRFRSGSMAVIKKDSIFDTDERERLQAAVLVARSVLSRLLDANYERSVLDRLMHSRKETTNAVFMLRGDVVIPYNPGAVSYADSCWEKDEVEHALAPEMIEALNKAITASWSSPVDAQWAELDLDLGGGLVRIGALARPEGNIIIYFAPPPRQISGGGTVPMLTRRQCDIMDWIAEGKTSAEVAIILEISPRTVEKHLEAVFQRFGVENRVAAVRSYLEAKGGLIPGQGA
ncbi:hypothetical protein KBB96_12720 [Luteolibacter ambystomatis]|uniref:HTH luxR-type domain-containing protein n=1 Tax=Luteolibacter ambystomatis TaxID=2824561 RepID=A0A975G6K7_9BACT|nr:helix-turn-helix transcriptional regulator [Luteolibacter ambystomatis]QUE49733.1 hypothetical protein KBB96_12720 [Luteolibacter ambystomatis]